MKKIIKIILLLVLSFVLTVPVYKCYTMIDHIYDYAEDNKTIHIEISEDNNKKSYAHEMRIVSLIINGKRINPEDIETDSWKWHEEWGYILYQEGDRKFDIYSEEPISSLKLEYVKEPGSGIADFYINNKHITTIDMYKSIWKNCILQIKCVSKIQKYIMLSEIFIIVFGLMVLISFCIKNIKEKVSVKPVNNSLGMFDLAKGLGMILIIAGHSFEAVSINGISESISSNLILGVIGIFAIYGMMPMFFIASGYGFRIGKIAETAQKQIRYWIKTYLIVALSSTLVFLLRFIFFADFSAEQFKYYALPFLFGNAHEGIVFGQNVFSIGPMWFGTALCFAWIILNVILNLKNKYIKIIGGVVVLVTGYYFSVHDLNIWCIPQTVFSIVMIYTGYLINKYKLFKNETSVTISIYMILACITLGISVYNGALFSIASGHWGNNYILALIAGTISGILILRLILQLNPITKGKCKRIKRIGRESYLVFYIHTFEWLVIPWKYVAKLNFNTVILFLVVFFMRGLLIFIIYSVIKRYKKRKRKVNGCKIEL